MIEQPLLLYTYRRRLECTGFSFGQHGNKKYLVQWKNPFGSKDETGCSCKLWATGHDIDDTRHSSKFNGRAFGLWDDFFGCTRPLQLPIHNVSYNSGCHEGFSS